MFQCRAVKEQYIKIIKQNRILAQLRLNKDVILFLISFFLNSDCIQEATHSSCLKRKFENVLVISHLFIYKTVRLTQQMCRTRFVRSFSPRLSLEILFFPINI